jgi:hypothetical protein
MDMVQFTRVAGEVETKLAESGDLGRFDAEGIAQDLIQDRWDTVAEVPEEEWIWALERHDPSNPVDYSM